ncbi:hypothetical protein GINT2_000429 [Glugoides intestinalis]
MENREKLNIALVSDFFYPSTGGVQSHISKIGEELYNLGHTVVVITHCYKDYKGIKKIGNLIVYYLDIPVIAHNDTIPTMFTNYVLYKEIFMRHGIQIVHGHQSLSNMCLEAIYHASSLSIKTVITDHSVFEIAKFERIIVNGLSRFVCKNVDWAICVSQISKENTHLRMKIPFDKITVIPNGIVPESFYPCKREITDKRKILFMSRFTFRKGVDLLVSALPLICKNKNFEVIIAGGGPKKVDILQTIDENDLHDQVKLIDEISYEDVPNFLRQGDIFLNTSLTETFCLAILEAVACGLAVVSTNVGGIHEIFSGDEVFFCEPTAEDIAEQIEKASVSIPAYDPFILYDYILSKYVWKTISKQIEKVYFDIPEKMLDFPTVIKQFSGPSAFLCRLATFVEYMQIKLFDLFMFKKQY